MTRISLTIKVKAGQIKFINSSNSYMRIERIEINKSTQYILCQPNNMFKPSLRKSILNDNLCLTTHPKSDPFHIPAVQKPKPASRFVDTLGIPPQTALPSMMVPEELLEKHTFHHQNNYTHIFTPLSYDFKPYPQAVKQIISSNPKAAQAGRINQVNYVVFGSSLLLWKSVNNGKDEEMLTKRKFPQVINIATFSVVKNQKMFKKEQVTLLAVSFMNRVELFKLDEQQLKLHDLHLKYQLKSCRFIQNIHFTAYNQVILAGDSGQFSMISLNSTKQMIAKVKSSILQKYLSKSAFDYSTRHIIRQIQVSHHFLYCLHDRISKTNYLMYLLKKAVNKVVMLSEEPKHIYEETFVDVYKFTNKERSELVLVNQLKQDDIEKKVKEGYVNFWGEGVKDAFRIVAINCKGQQTPEAANPLIEVTTKCGYILNLIHEITGSDNSAQKQTFSFVSQPTKLPSKLGQASFFQPKVFISAPQQKEYRKNHVIKCLPITKHQSMTIMNDSLIFTNNQSISAIKFSNLKLGVYNTTSQQQTYISEEEFNKRYQPSKATTVQAHQTLFGHKKIVYNRQEEVKPVKYYRLFNNQQRFTVFDNEGCFHVYPLEVKHIILAYVYYQCEFNFETLRQQSQFDQKTHFLIETDMRLHSTFDKIIKLYGYSAFMSALVQILTNNSANQREYFYLQSDLLLEVLKKDFEYDLPNTFQSWSYNLSQHSQTQPIVPTDKMLQFLWITLFEHQNKSILTSENILSQTPLCEYTQKAKQYIDAKTRLEYTAYSYALKAKFYSAIQILIYFRAKQFKLKQKQLKECQQQLVHFFNFLQTKYRKAQTQEYKTYLDMKMLNLRKKEPMSKNYLKKNTNQTLSTTFSSLNSTQESFAGLDEEHDTYSAPRVVTQMANETVEKHIDKSIQKIISLIDVMHILIEKDERQGLPNFIQIATNFKHQVKIGQQFFREELFFSANTVEFIHPELVKKVSAVLPELRLENKINFLKFKLAKNIATNNSSVNEIDLKSLNFDKLSSLITSSQLPEAKKIFLGEVNGANFQKTYFYTEFLSISLAKLILKVKQLSSLKQQSTHLTKLEFNSLSQGNSAKSTSLLATHITVEKILLSQQQLEYYQEEMAKFFAEIKQVFSTCVATLKTINGPQYYEAEKYFDRMIEMLTTNFASQQIMLQTLEIILKDGNLFQKVHFMKQLKDRAMHMQDPDVQILKLAKQKQTKFEQKSTFQYLMTQAGDKKLAEQTMDTLNTASMR